MKQNDPLSKELPFFYYFYTRFLIKAFNLIPNHSKFDSTRTWLLRLAGFKVEKTAKVFKPLRVSPKTILKNIELGDYCFINSNSRFSAPCNSKIKIGRKTLVGPNAIFETVNHNVKMKNEKRGAVLNDIFIEELSWLGANVIILPGVEIGKRTLIAAGSIVTKSYPNDSKIAGVPAKSIK